MFVASIPLNHAILEEDSFALELSDQQIRGESFAAHRDYFERPYAYKKFFGPRARVLHAYATQAGRRPVPAFEEWRAVNRSFALSFVENVRAPMGAMSDDWNDRRTRSLRCADEPGTLAQDDFVASPGMPVSLEVAARVDEEAGALP